MKQTVRESSNTWIVHPKLKFHPFSAHHCVATGAGDWVLSLWPFCSSLAEENSTRSKTITDLNAENTTGAVSPEWSKQLCKDTTLKRDKFQQQRTNETGVCWKTSAQSSRALCVLMLILWMLRLNDDVNATVLSQIGLYHIFYTLRRHQMCSVDSFVFLSTKYVSFVIGVVVQRKLDNIALGALLST